MKTSIETLLVKYYCDELTTWSVVSEMNAIEPVSDCNFTALQSLRELIDDSDHDKNRIIQMLKDVHPDIDNERFGSLLMEHWLQELKLLKIDSSRFVENIR